MNTRRLIIALACALSLSGLVTLFVSHKINVSSHAARQVVNTKIVASSRALQVGEVLKAESLTMVDWPSNVALQGASTKTTDLVGRYLLYPLSAGQPILETFLAPAGSGSGLTAKIPDGMRATSVKSDEIAGVAGFLFPGSHVDVLVTFRPDNSGLTATQIVLQDVEVLTAGQKSEPDPQPKPDNVGVVTLLLSPEDAQKLVLVSAQGTIHFVLRNGADHNMVSTVPVKMAELSGHVQLRDPIGAPRVAVRIPAKKAYVVETLMGDKRATAEFE